MNVSARLMVVIALLGVMPGIFGGGEEPLALVIQEYKNDLAARDHALHQEVRGILGATTGEWEKIQKSSKRSYRAVEVSLKQEAKNRCSQPLNEALKSMTQELIWQVDLDPAEIEIIPESSYAYSEAYTTEHAIFLNQPLLLQANEENEMQVRGSLLHELFHIKCGDNYTAHCLNQLCDKKMSYLSDDQIIKWNDWLTRWHHFRELRADILACLEGVRFAQARVDFTKKNFYAYVDVESETHPTWSTRYKTVKLVLERMQVALGKILLGGKS